ncbi:hypothetical protein V500_07368 [Pseudogymnoascus sp. VKM F-4518 (FW-2643)]|nr:hypothetical protein V500_07368 [Pseudogymnoascus sp. VKM F-4518 (FW-2643)]
MSSSTNTENQPVEPALQTPDPPKVETGSLRGAVKFNDYQHFDRLACILGLGNKAAVQAWMASDSFKPAYDELVRDWISSQWDKAVDGMRRKRAPTLKQITDAISKAPERYTSPTGIIDKTNFVEIDHYALCLVLLRAANESNFNGLFRGKTCSDEHKDQRLWQAMLRGGAEAWRRRKRSVKLTPGEEMYV